MLLTDFHFLFSVAWLIVAVALLEMCDLDQTSYFIATLMAAALVVGHGLIRRFSAAD